MPSSSSNDSKVRDGNYYHDNVFTLSYHQIRILCITGVSVVLFMLLMNDVLPALSPNSYPKRTVARVDFQTAERESYGFFDDVTAYHWSLMKRRVSERKNHNDEKHGHRSKIIFMDQPEAWYQNNWEPDFTCQHERRVGGLGAGGKWVCDPHRIPRASRQRTDGGCLVYSFGSSGDLKFEYGLREIDPNCEIHVFDNTHQFESYRTAPNTEGMRFHPWSLEGSRNPTNSRRSMTLQETVEALGHSRRVVDVFKLKCTDGCEWRTYKDWFESDIVPMQILVEVHNSPRRLANDLFETMQKRGYVTFHKEPNTQFCAGKCQNYSFLKLAPEFFT